MAKFSSLLWSDAATTPVASAQADRNKPYLLAQHGHIEAWIPPDFSVQGKPTDNLANDVGYRLFSPKLKDIIKSARDRDDDLQWLEATVTDERGAADVYLVLHFPSDLDCLDHEQSLTVEGGVVVRPVISIERVGTRKIFCWNRLHVGPVIAHSVKAAIVTAGCTGVYFGSIRQS